MTARGNERKAIYLDEADFELFLDTLDAVCYQHNWVIHAYCLMNNHYHLLLETPDANLSKGMRQLNGVFTQAMNKNTTGSATFFKGVIK
ncbi:transposase [Aeromonas caviae]|uniref:transposase n=1 Tax=Aeromonas caviae TaxID=648 RepID=UPI00190F2627